MSLEVSQLGESSQAPLARVGLLVIVRAEMLLERGGEREGPGAHLALKRLLSTVHPVVHFEVGGLGEGSAAQLTLVGFLSAVRGRVPLEVGGRGEDGRTQEALVLPPGVDAHVVDQLLQLLELLPAGAAAHALVVAVSGHVVPQERGLLGGHWTLVALKRPRTDRSLIWIPLGVDVHPATSFP